MDNQLTPLQSKLLDMFKWFHAFCEQYDLRYYALGGTMLGAVRHQGFIPWDDDIDVGMPRKDYKRLQQLLKGQTGRYILEYPGLKEDYFYPISKLYDTTTTLIENTRNHIRRGIFLDIFPLDGLGNSLNEAQRNYKPIANKLNLLLARTTGIRTGRKWSKNLAILIARIIPNILLDNRELLLSIDDLCQKRDFDTCAYGGNFLGAWRFKEIMSREIMGMPTSYKFEDMQVYGAQNYDGYLTNLYGNWQQLPPKEKQVTHHDFIELNLNKPYITGDIY